MISKQYLHRRTTSPFFSHTTGQYHGASWNLFILARTRPELPPQDGAVSENADCLGGSKGPSAFLTADTCHHLALPLGPRLRPACSPLCRSFRQITDNPRLALTVLAGVQGLIEGGPRQLIRLYR